MKVRLFLKRELFGWKKSEILWLVLTCGIIAALSVYWGDSLLGIVSAVTGIAYVIFAGKGKLSAYMFGVINSICYAIVSFEARLYGETMLNVFYYFPMQFVGFFVWSRNINSETGEVRKRHMKNMYRIIMVLTIFVLTYAYGKFLAFLGDSMPYVDSFTTVSSVIALIVSIGMFSEQWWIWLFVNSLSIYMWWCNFSAGSDNLATLLMWGVYLVSGIMMLIKWEKEISKTNRLTD